MSPDYLAVVAACLDAWETARACFWHRINELLADKGTAARLRELNGARSSSPTPTGGVTLADALPALRVAIRNLALHIDVPDRFAWLVLGPRPMPSNGSLNIHSIEHELQRAFTDLDAVHLDAGFWQREIVEPTMMHAENMRVALRREQEKARSLVELKTPLVEMLQAVDRLGRANAKEICEEINATTGRKVNPTSAKRPLRVLVERGLLQSSKGRGAEYVLTPLGKAVLSSLPQ